MEEPGGLQSMGSQRVGHNWATSLHFFTSGVEILTPPPPPLHPSSYATKNSASYIFVSQPHCLLFFLFKWHTPFCLSRYRLIFARVITEPVTCELGENEQGLEGWIVGHLAIAAVSLHCQFWSGCLSQLPFLRIFSKFISLRALGNCSSLESSHSPVDFQTSIAGRYSCISILLLNLLNIFLGTACAFGNSLLGGQL